MIDILLIICTIMMIICSRGPNDLISVIYQKLRPSPKCTIGNSDAQIGLIARFNNGPVDSYSWICKDLTKDAERFLIKPFEEIFDSNLDIFIVSTSIFKARQGIAATFKECLTKTVFNRGRIMESVQLTHSLLSFKFC